MSSNFMGMLEDHWDAGKFVCVGLDSDFKLIPHYRQEYAQRYSHKSEKHERQRSPIHTMLGFNRSIIDQTYDLVCAYKPNFAFYKHYGAEGLQILQETIRYGRSVNPTVPWILDTKDVDIGNTNIGSVEFAFGYLGVDAITVNPYMGGEALFPFLEQKEKGIIVICRTSNPGAGEFQDLPIPLNQKTHALLESQVGHRVPKDSIPLYQHVALSFATQWNTRKNCGLVVGATCPEELRQVREIVGDMPILIPGVGFQQKDVPLETQVAQVVNNGKTKRNRGIIVNSARGIIFAKNPREETVELSQLITRTIHPTLVGT